LIGTVEEHIMSHYEPDNWVIVKFEGKTPHYKVLAGWSGGYLSGSSWRMNSGIVEVQEDEDYWIFIGDSGSKYACHKDGYGLRMNNVHVWNQLEDIHKDKVTLMDEGVDWMSVDWLIKRKDATQ